MNDEPTITCPECGNEENFHFNYDRSKPDHPIEEILCNECGTYFNEKTNMIKIYLDDIRTPNDPTWTVVRSYNEFIDKINEVGLDSIDQISLDHDLGDTAMKEYYNNVSPNYTLNYENITEKTGMDCVKWLVDLCLDNNLTLPLMTVHSANPIGSANMMGYINNFLMNTKRPQNCVRVKIPHTIKKD